MQREWVVLAMALLALLVWMAWTLGSGEPQPAGRLSRDLGSARSAERGAESQSSTRRVGEAPESRTGEPDVPVDPVEVAAPKVKVTVRLAEGDAPVPGAHVVVTAGDRRVQESTTDDAGVARFDELPEEEVMVAAFAPDCARACDNLDLEVGDEMVIELVLRPGARLDGEVHDENGRPIAGARVALARGGVLGHQTMSCLEPPYPAVTTDPEGRFAFDGVLCGEIHTVFAAKPGRASVWQGVRMSHRATDRRPVVVVLPQGGSLTGQVRDPDGEPFTGALVVLAPAGSEHLLREADMAAWVAGPTDEGGLSARSGTDGRFSVDGLVFGARYTARVTAAGGWTAAVGELLIVGVSAPVITRDVTLLRPGRLVVHVLGPDGTAESAAEVEVRLFGARGVQISHGRVGPDCEYDDLEPGDWMVRASHESLRDDEVRVSVPVGQSQEVTIRLVEGLAISGLVTDTDGEPVADTEVRAWRPADASSDDGPPSTARSLSGADGRFELRGVRIGAHRIVAMLGGHETAQLDDVSAGAAGVHIVLRRLGSAKARLRLPPGGSRPAELGMTYPGGTWAEDWPEDGFVRWDGLPWSEVEVGIVATGYARWSRRIEASGPDEIDLGEITLDPGITVEGQCLDERRRPVSGVQIEVGEIWTPEHQIAESDAQGRYRLVHQPRTERTVHVAHPDHVSGYRTLDVAGGEIGWNLVVVRGGRIVGRVVTSGGVGRPDLTVVCRRIEGPRVSADDSAWTDTAADGSFALRVPAGKWRVVVPLRDDAERSCEVTVVEDREVRADFDLSKE